MMNKTLISALLVSFLPLATQAAQLELPQGASLAAEMQEKFTSQRLAIGAFANGDVPTIWAEGARRLEAWQSPTTGLTTLQVIAPLRDQLIEQGYDILYECRDHDCGGFDFRYAQELLPEPDMHVNLGDYRYLSAQRMGKDAPEYVSLMVSRNRSAGFVHVTSVGPNSQTALVPVATSTKNIPTVELPTLTPTAGGSLVDLLEASGAAVLEDLKFTVGSSKLAAQDFPSLEELANHLNTKPDLTIALVGHTDAVGSQANNLRLSKSRAAAVRARLVQEFGVSPRQIEAEGVGYLAPLASNASEDGRNLNRRVEVVVTSVN